MKKFLKSALSSLCLLSLIACSSRSNSGDDGNNSMDKEYYRVARIVVEESYDLSKCFNTDHINDLKSSEFVAKYIDTFFTYDKLSNKLSEMKISESNFTFFTNDFDDSFSFLFLRYGNILDDYRYWNFRIEGMCYRIDEDLMEEKSGDGHFIIDIVFIPLTLAQKYKISDGCGVEYCWRHQ